MRRLLPGAISWLVVTGMAMAGQFEDLGVPVVKAGLMGAIVGPDANGEDTLLYFNFNQSGGPLFLVQVNPRTGEARQFGAPPGNPGAWAFIVGPDKRIYLGTWDGGHILRFDPRAPEKGIELVGKPSQTESYLWNFTIGPDRKLYACTYPNAKLVSYDPFTGEMEDLGRLDPEEKYSQWMATGPDGWVYTGIGTVRAQVVGYNPATGERRGILPEDQRPAGSGQVYLGKDGLPYARLGGQWYRLAGGLGTPIPESDWPGSPPRMTADGKVLAAADLDGNYTLVDNATGEKTEGHFDYKGDGSPVFVVGAGPGGVIYGSTAMPLELFAYDPATGETTNPGNPTNVGGEIYSFATWHNLLYMCAYPGSAMSRYDPGKPWNKGDTPDHNPYCIGNLGDGHLRPRAMIVGPGDKLYVGSYPPYGQWGGAMAVFDPRTNQVVENYRGIIEDQAIAALAYDPETGLIFGGSSIYGGGGTTPKADHARFFVWDPAGKRKLAQLSPSQDADTIVALAVARGKVFIATSGSPALVVYDIASRSIVHRGEIPQGRVHDISLQLHTDGLIYGLAGNSLITVSPETCEVREFARSPVDISCGWALTDTGLYFGSGVHLWRWKW